MKVSLCLCCVFVLLGFLAPVGVAEHPDAQVQNVDSIRAAASYVPLITKIDAGYKVAAFNINKNTYDLKVINYCLDNDVPLKQK